MDNNLTDRLAWLKDNASDIVDHVQQLKDDVTSRFSEEVLVRQFQKWCSVQLGRKYLRAFLTELRS